MSATLAPELTYVTNEMWVEALRSGEYQQCHGTAGRNSGGWALMVGGRMTEATSFCCLTVQADLSGSEVLDYLNPDYAELSHITSYRAGDLLALDTWTDEQRVLIAGHVNIGFMYLNDTVKASFEQIADVIEQVGPIA